MKLLILLLPFLFIACNWQHPSNAAVQKKQSKDTITRLIDSAVIDTTSTIVTTAVLDSTEKYLNSRLPEKKITNDDTTYYIEDFLIECTKEMKFDFISRNHKIINLVSKGDTLYHTKYYTILGDREETRGWGVYKKMPSTLDSSAYSVSDIYKGVLAKPDFKTDPDARGFRTRIREGCSDNGINFAGHYTIAEWGCGSMCISMAVIDRINGHIYYSNLPFQQNDGYYGSEFEADSRLLIINSALLEAYKGYYGCVDYMKPEVYEWKDSTFRKIHLAF